LFSITVTINAAPDETFSATLLNPNVLVKRIRSLSTPTGTGTVTFNAAATTKFRCWKYTYTATDANGCSKSITVTINEAPDEITFSATLVNPNVFLVKGSVV
jgi:1-deoxy-D-xylulose 5-phosphate reductoisomerase